MKKSLLIFFAVLITGIATAQKPFVLFGHAPKDMFSTDLTVDRTWSGDFLWSFDATVSGLELGLKSGETEFLSAAGFAFGYKHYKPKDDGTPIADYGINLAILTRIKLNEIVDTRMKLALLANVYNFTAGPVYTFGDNRIGLLIGANISF